MAQLDQEQIDRLLSSFMGGLMTVADPKMVRASVLKISESDEVWEAWGKFINQLESEVSHVEDLQQPAGSPRPEAFVPPKQGGLPGLTVGGAVVPPKETNALVNPEQPIAVNRRPA